MPLYEFRCDDCGVFDAWKQMAECHIPDPCPTCHQNARRIFSPPAVNLSGSLRFKPESPEPQRIKREVEPAARPRVQSHSGGRPWMIGH